MERCLKCPVYVFCRPGLKAACEAVLDDGVLTQEEQDDLDEITYNILTQERS